LLIGFAVSYATMLVVASLERMIPDRTRRSDMRRPIIAASSSACFIQTDEDSGKPCS
jgi:hypothetical protein